MTQVHAASWLAENWIGMSEASRDFPTAKNGIWNRKEGFGYPFPSQAQPGFETHEMIRAGQGS